MLPETFQFTQSNLQDYVTCPRRFQLRYVRRMNWPAVETAPVQEAERRMQLGSDFHRMVQQHTLGVPADLLAAGAEQSAELAMMWQRYRDHRPPELARDDARLFPEVTLSTVLDGWRLAAKFDLLTFLPDDPPCALIIDWKTNVRRPQSARLRAHLQSRVYPFVLAQSAQSLLGESVSPERITLQYWFAADPAAPEIIDYDAAQLAADEVFLRELISQITAATDFPLTEERRACRFCIYRSFCERGDLPGSVDEFDEDWNLQEFDLDWEQISEIAY